MVNEDDEAALMLAEARRVRLLALPKDTDGAAPPIVNFIDRADAELAEVVRSPTVGLAAGRKPARVKPASAARPRRPLSFLSALLRQHHICVWKHLLYRAPTIERATVRTRS